MQQYLIIFALLFIFPAVSSSQSSCSGLMQAQNQDGHALRYALRTVQLYEIRDLALTVEDMIEERKAWSVRFEFNPNRDLSPNVFGQGQIDIDSVIFRTSYLEDRLEHGAEWYGQPEFPEHLLLTHASQDLESALLILESGVKSLMRTGKMDNQRAQSLSYILEKIALYKRTLDDPAIWLPQVCG